MNTAHTSLRVFSSTPIFSEADCAIPCPICGRETGARTRVPHTPWSTAQDWLLRRMRAVGVADKGMGLVLGAGKWAINARINQLRVLGRYRGP